MIRVSKIVVYPVGVIANPDIKNYEDTFIGNLELSNHKEIANQIAEILDLGDVYQYSTSTNLTKLNFQTIKDEIVYQVKSVVDED